VEELDPPHPHRAQRVPVVGAGEVEEAGAGGLAAPLLVEEGHLEGDLHRGGTVVGVEDPREARAA
jgi:hypothetical protein